MGAWVLNGMLGETIEHNRTIGIDEAYCRLRATQ